MFNRRSKQSAALFMAVSLGSASCRDLPTAAAGDVRNQPDFPSRASRNVGTRSRFECLVSSPAVLGRYRFRYARMNMAFPDSADAPHGATRLYLIRVQAPGQQPVAAANCRIPATRGAVAEMDRLVKRLGGSRSPSTQTSSVYLPGDPRFAVAATGGPRYDSGCVTSSSGCTLEPIGVTVPPYGGGGWASGPDDACGGWMCWDKSYQDYGGGDSWDPGAPTGTSSGDPKAFEEGPLLWAGCVLAVVGSGMAIDQVADAFKTWYDAAQNLQAEQRVMDSLHANQDNVDPGSYQVEQYRLEQAQQKAADAAGNVSSITNVSYVALAAAAVACGASVLMPTP